MAAYCRFKETAFGYEAGPNFTLLTVASVTGSEKQAKPIPAQLAGFRLLDSPPALLPRTQRNDHRRDRQQAWLTLVSLPHKAQELGLAAWPCAT